MSNLSELNKVIKALGGTGDATNNAEAIGKIAALAGGGGGGAFTVKLTEDDQNNWSSDKTFAQIKAAIEGGQAVSALAYSGTDLICIAPLTWYDFTEGDGMITFSAMTVVQATNTLGALYYYVEEDNSVTATPLYYTLTPSD